MKNILLIEDNEDVRENTAEILRFASYEVSTAPDGEKGLEKARQMLPDMIICDIMMPKMDGYQVLEELSKDAKTASIPFLFLTAKSEKVDIRYGMNKGADDYITKPFEEHELLDAVAMRLKKNEFYKREYSKNVQGFKNFLAEASEYEDLSELSGKYDLTVIAKGETIFSEGNNARMIYFIQKGSVKTYKGTEMGKEFVTGIFGKGSYIGQMSLLSDSSQYAESAIALDDCELYGIPKNDFMTLLQSNPVVAEKFIKMISNNVVELQEKLVSMAFSPVRQRAAKALLKLSDNDSGSKSSSEGIDIPREDFAGIIGTATETAIRALSSFRDEGLIAIGLGRRLIVKDEKGLKRIAGFS